MRRWTLLPLVLLVTTVVAIEHDSICTDDAECAEPSHTVIRLAERDDSLARQIAESHGMHVKGEPFLENHYFIYHNEKRNRRQKRAIIDQLEAHPAVEWIDEQRPRLRTKRDFVFTDQVSEKEDRKQSTPLEIPRLPFPDPLYSEQWYLIGEAKGGFDLNVREAWLLGYAGRNVSVSIIDDGIQRDHPDLAANYDPLASTDIIDHDNDPTPQNNAMMTHGTMCAGAVGSIAGNDQCGVGVAFKSKIGGVRMLEGQISVSDSVEAAAFSHNQQHIDIYSSSWGPTDDGGTFDGPGPLAREAFYRGIKNGRGGKGNIFVWASGNGGEYQDSCSADGYTTSIYTLSISSASISNRLAYHSEECPSTIATTYSSSDSDRAIVSIDVPTGCTTGFTGTSASAPLAAGIIALALEANPSLTWRDMQHLVLRTANAKPLINNPGWSINGVGRQISNKFGYGLMDGGALVKLSKTWKTVPEQHNCTYEYKLAAPNPRPITGRFKLNFTLDVDGCEWEPSRTPVLYLEHVQVHSTIRYGRRGDLKLTLFSPAGTRSVLLPPRPHDSNKNGITNWPFLSVQQWGEDPRGTWVLMVESVTDDVNLEGTFHDWSLLLYGTADPAQPGDPVHPPSPPPPTQSVLGRVQQLTSQNIQYLLHLQYLSHSTVLFQIHSIVPRILSICPGDSDESDEEDVVLCVRLKTDIYKGIFELSIASLTFELCVFLSLFFFIIVMRLRLFDFSKIFTFLCKDFAVNYCIFVSKPKNHKNASAVFVLPNRYHHFCSENFSIVTLYFCLCVGVPLIRTVWFTQKEINTFLEI